MRLLQVMAILEDAVRDSSPVMVHFGYDSENIIVISGPKEPLVKVDVAFDDLIHVSTKSNMQFFIRCKPQRGFYAQYRTHNKIGDQRGDKRYISCRHCGWSGTRA